MCHKRRVYSFHKAFSGQQPFNQLTGLLAQEGFVEFSRCDISRSHSFHYNTDVVDYSFMIINFKKTELLVSYQYLTFQVSFQIYDTCFGHWLLCCTVLKSLCNGHVFLLLPKFVKCGENQFPIYTKIFQKNC
jgi:hypothetical protein